jgi:hypothetical protein
MHFQGPRTSFADIFTDLFNGRQSIDLRGHSAVTYATLLEAIFSVIVEIREAPRMTLGKVKFGDVVQALRGIYSTLHGRRGNDRVALLMRWHTIAIILLETDQDAPGDLSDVERARLSLLHANAIKQLAEDLSFSSLSSPHCSMPYSVHKASTILIRWIGVRSRSESERQYALERQVDWQDLLRHGWDFSMRTALDVTPELLFIVHGGDVTVEGAPMGHHDVLPMVTLLQAFGRVWDAASVMAENLSSQLVT